MVSSRKKLQPFQRKSISFKAIATYKRQNQCKAGHYPCDGACFFYRLIIYVQEVDIYAAKEK